MLAVSSARSARCARAPPRAAASLKGRVFEKIQKGSLRKVFGADLCTTVSAGNNLVLATFLRGHPCFSACFDLSSDSFAFTIENSVKYLILPLSSPIPSPPLPKQTPTNPPRCPAAGTRTRAAASTRKATRTHRMRAAATLITTRPVRVNRTGLPTLLQRRRRRPPARAFTAARGRRAAALLSTRTPAAAARTPRPPRSKAWGGGGGACNLQQRACEGLLRRPVLCEGLLRQPVLSNGAYRLQNR